MSRCTALLLWALLAGACKPSASSGSEGDASDWTQVVDLGGVWRFRIGERPDLPAASDTTGWTSIPAPAPWEEAGFWGYDGYAWYQKRFRVPAASAALLRNRAVYLRLGRVDDADVVYLNGRLLGATGRMPPEEYQTAYLTPRLYRIPWGYLDPGGENVLSVRVFDAELSGGIIDGPLDLVVAPPDDLLGAPMVADLAGLWRLQEGDDPRRAAPHFDDTHWPQVTVPVRWEVQGMAGYDGFAWYRRTFKLTAGDVARDLVLVLGAVDDLDEVFVNSVRIGGTGDIQGRQISGDEWAMRRAYSVPPGVLQPGENVVAVRVYDGMFDGGIYAGPVGLMAADVYRRVHGQGTN